MKYRILLLLALVCAVGVAALGGTLAGYTAETSLGISIQPETADKADEQTAVPTERQAQESAQPDAGATSPIKTQAQQTNQPVPSETVSEASDADEDGTMARMEKMD